MVGSGIMLERLAGRTFLFMDVRHHGSHSNPADRQNTKRIL
jgi:hypothetical protein